MSEGYELLSTEEKKLLAKHALSIFDRFKKLKLTDEQIAHASQYLLMFIADARNISPEQFKRSMNNLAHAYEMSKKDS